MEATSHREEFVEIHIWTGPWGSATYGKISAVGPAKTVPEKEGPSSGEFAREFFECFGLMDLQDGHRMQGGGGLSSGTVSLSSQGCHRLTGLGRETWTLHQVDCTSAPQLLAPPGESPCNSWRPHYRG